MKVKKMTVKLNYDLIHEIVSHGSKTKQGETTDPSTNSILEETGVAMVTTYIEQLSLLNIVRDPSPIFGKYGGMWIGYKLTDIGYELATSETNLKKAVAELTGDAKHEVSQSVYELLDECKSAPINEAYKLEFLRTLEEIAICFDTECYIATIGLCGKILEVCLKEILIRHGQEFDPNVMIGQLLRKIREQIPNEYIDPSLENIASIINKSRITAVHAKESIPIPSRDQAVMVIFATREVVRRNLSHIREIH